ncbi:Glutathione import ATP-binding protein GsiA,microcin C ABC transporter ATP-binding protein YejF,ABC-type oligopeptide transport system, ATPase component,nickel import ATP-binding protein NikE,ABC transporter [Chlamydia serpentis]|uniref:ABC transporter domain-containing protein n=1 Tax=Chlamydia serpentis TaxID=1967782 RepID=A0A2R8FAB2_9CHLA|nr:ABC transporter ATP-binding protein [Chlamydia serpentis]SPN73358.1 Glutathione import ATP-binding protein GsiA,microcin C ABC transporter ATP-binding protein YejF,ABC-type oligopeptide transport system, ATPase component,nickel import ATP-binding protein NikE,ABC transporter [Chlamydia serpentis]
MTTLLSIEDLSVTIRGKKILNQINLQLMKGSCLTIVGPSGSGKSSLALTVLNLLKRNTGTITFNIDTNLPRARKLQVIWQDIDCSLNPCMSIKTIIAEPLNIIGNYSKTEQEKEIYNVLDLVNLPKSILNLKPYKLSGGQKQRVVIAKALVSKPELLICDEPLSSLDTLNQSLILDLFQTIKKEYRNTLLFITHDMSAAYYIADTIAVMDQGNLVEYGSREKIFSTPQHIITQELLDAIPSFSLISKEIQSSNTYELEAVSK